MSEDEVSNKGQGTKSQFATMDKDRLREIARLGAKKRWAKWRASRAGKASAKSPNRVQFTSESSIKANQKRWAEYRRQKYGPKV